MIPSIRSQMAQSVAPVIGVRHGSFSPQALFALGQQGAWYDPSDLTTLFQDSAGTIPVTGTGQPVGLMLDKRLGLVRGAELASGLTPFSDASGTTTHTESAITTTGSLGGVTLPLTVGNWYALSATGGTSATELSINTANLAINPTARTVIRTTIGDCVFLADKPFLYLRQTGTGTGTVNSLSLKELPGNHAAQPTAASRPIFRDVGGLRYLECDGVDDGMVTGSIDFTGTDKMLSVIGWRKLSDYTQQWVYNHNNVAAGSFRLQPSANAASASITSVAVGSASLTSASTNLPAPASFVATSIHDLAAAGTSLKVNGVTPVPGSGAGGGTFASAPLYLFSRSNLTNYCGGFFFGAIIAGSTYSAAQIASAERYLAGKSGVTL